MAVLDLAIAGGTVVTPTGPAALDIGVKDGVTAMLVAPGSLPEAGRTVDAAGKVVLPGGVYPHVHTNAPNGRAGVRGRDIITKAALYGGMTTIIDFIFPGTGSPTAELKRMVETWDGTSYTDYGFHVVLSDATPDAGIAEIPAMIAASLLPLGGQEPRPHHSRDLGRRDRRRAKVALLYTELVRKRGLGLRRLAQVSSENAAKIFGLFPQKGAILVGSDADYVVIDPADEHPAKAADLNEGDWTPWEDWVLSGWPACTVKGGPVVVEGNVMVDDSMGGSLLRRTLDPSVHAGTALD